MKLEVSPSYALDYFAILIVKKNRGLAVELPFEEFRGQISNLDQILESQEFQKLIFVNAQLFEAIELLRKQDFSAIFFDSLNRTRYFAKLELDKKFFNAGMEAKSNIVKLHSFQ